MERKSDLSCEVIAKIKFVFVRVQLKCYLKRPERQGTSSQCIFLFRKSLEEGGRGQLCPVSLSRDPGSFYLVALLSIGDLPIG